MIQLIVPLLAVLSCPGPALAEDEVLAQLQPPATAEELALYQETKAKEPKALPQFIATRKYFRILKAKFPGEVDAAKAPPPSKNVVFKFTLDDNEASLLYDIKLKAAKRKALP